MPSAYRALPERHYACAYMSITYIASVAIDVLLIVHCFRTGRNTMWIWAIAFIPFAGAIAYVVVEVLPGLTGHRVTRRAVRGMGKALDPQQDLRRFELEARISGGAASRQRYADELCRHQRYAEAIAVYREALSGLYEYDPKLLMGLAQAQFASGDATGSRTTLETLIAKNPEFKSPDGHLLYARALEAEGNTSKALEEYRALAQYYAGAEAKLRLAQLLKITGSKDEARAVLRDLLDHARAAPRHYRRAQRAWLEQAEQELSGPLRA
jgi:hypothetical protein